MRKSRHLAISSRLEATKQFGLVTDYRIDWPARSMRLSPRVTVWGRAAVPGQVTKNYIIQLLENFVPAREINVAVVRVRS